jgi:hypothetical protein
MLKFCEVNLFFNRTTKTEIGEPGQLVARPSIADRVRQLLNVRVAFLFQSEESS